MNNISIVLDDKCTGCGLCESVCPVNAISMSQQNGFFRPVVSRECIDCGMCVNYCSGKLRKNTVDYNFFKYKVYGHSRDDIVRKNAASGGCATEFLKYLLDQNIVDYVVTSEVYGNDRNLGYAIVDKLNSKKLFTYSGSNYCPVNIGRAVKEIRRIEGRYALVCLPCLSTGLEELRKNDVVLKKRIKYVVSLLCNHLPSYEATDYLIKRYKIRKPKMIKYRGDGWFGKFRAFDNVNNEGPYFSVPYTEYFGTNFSLFFCQKACINCIDHFGGSADVCMGDADFVKFHSRVENNGETMIFTNSDEVLRLLCSMQKKRILSLFNDVTQTDLQTVYGPLSDINRLSIMNTRCGFRSVIREERINGIVLHFKKVYLMLKGCIKKILLRTV